MRPLPALHDQALDLDHNATAPLHPLAIAAMRLALDRDPGNPSSTHGRGQAGRALVEQARRQLATVLGAAPNELALTSGATESNVLAWRGVLEPLIAAGRRPAILTSAVEHASVRALAAEYRGRGLPVHELGVDHRGQWRMHELPVLLRDAEPGLVSLIWVNNETGVIHPVGAAALAVRGVSRGAVVHCDATQAVGRIPVDVGALGADLLSISGHKFGGPKGVGALWVRSGAPIAAVAPGHQELALRAGTENVLGIAGMGAAATTVAERLQAMAANRVWRDALWQQLRELGADRNADVAEHDETGHVLNLSFHGVAAPLLVMALDLAGLQASAGSACASGTLEPSHVQLAMHGDSDSGLRRAKSALRLSLGPGFDRAALDRAVGIFHQVVPRLRMHLAQSLGQP